MVYEVQVTSEAEKQFDEFLNYLVYRKLNPQAAKHFIDDFEETIKLSSMRYFMAYRIMKTK